MLIKMGINELCPSNSNRKAAAFFHNLCPDIGSLGIKLLSDDDPKEINAKSLSNFMGHFPMGTSLKTVQHFK